MYIWIYNENKMKKKIKIKICNCPIIPSKFIVSYDFDFFIKKNNDIIMIIKKNSYSIASGWF